MLVLAAASARAFTSSHFRWLTTLFFFGPPGKVIKACFGTTKYCNAFLKGVACNNSDCLYLHEVGEQLPLPLLIAYCRPTCLHP